jgi:hypothetical protein
MFKMATLSTGVSWSRLWCGLGHLGATYFHLAPKVIFRGRSPRFACEGGHSEKLDVLSKDGT